MFVTVTGNSSVDEVEVRDTILLRHLADKFNLSFHAFGKDIQKTDGPTHGSLTLRDAFGTALEPAPVTPTDEKAVAYQVLSGTIKSTFKEFRRGGGEFRDIVVIPGIMPANTGGCLNFKLLVSTMHLSLYRHKTLLEIDKEYFPLQSHQHGDGIKESRGSHCQRRYEEFLSGNPK